MLGTRTAGEAVHVRGAENGPNEGSPWALRRCLMGCSSGAHAVKKAQSAEGARPRRVGLLPPVKRPRTYATAPRKALRATPARRRPPHGGEPGPSPTAAPPVEDSESSESSTSSDDEYDYPAGLGAGRGRGAAARGGAGGTPCRPLSPVRWSAAGGGVRHGALPSRSAGRTLLPTSPRRVPGQAQRGACAGAAAGPATPASPRGGARSAAAAFSPSPSPAAGAGRHGAAAGAATCPASPQPPALLAGPGSPRQGCGAGAGHPGGPGAGLFVGGSGHAECAPAPCPYGSPTRDGRPGSPHKGIRLGRGLAGAAAMRMGSLYDRQRPLRTLRSRQPPASPPPCALEPAAAPAPAAPRGSGAPPAAALPGLPPLWLAPHVAAASAPGGGAGVGGGAHCQLAGRAAPAGSEAAVSVSAGAAFRPPRLACREPP